MTLRILSYNIHKGFSLRREFVLQRIREAIQETEADLVFLQEVLGHHEHPSRRIPEYETTAQFEYLADSLWPHFAYGKNAIYDEGHHGNAILSRWPLVQSLNTDISNHLLERRGLLSGQIHFPNLKPLHLGCLHLDLTQKGRTQQLQKILAWLASLPPEDPVILAGDFNDWNRALNQQFYQQGGLQEVFLQMKGQCAKTYPSWLPLLSLDRIFFRGIKPTHCRSLKGHPWRDLSDHIPLLAELQFQF